MSRRTLLTGIALSSLATAACAGLLGIDDKEYTGPEQTDLEGGPGPGTDATAIDSPILVDGATEAASCVGVDLATDPKNCGACGRACGPSQPCVQSACGPTVIASRQSLGPALASDGTSVYWSTPAGAPLVESGIRRCSDVNGCGIQGAPFTGPRPSPTTYIALGRTNVYWREESGGFYSCPKVIPTPQTTCTPRHISDFVPPTATFLESADGFVYWVKADAAAGGGSIWRMVIDQTDGGGSPFVFSTQGGNQPISALLHRPPVLFWAQEGQLWSCLSQNGSPCANGGLGGTPVVPISPATQSLSASDGGIFWSESLAGGSVRVLRGGDGGNAPTVESVARLDGGVAPGLVVASEGNVYFSSNDGVLTRCPVSGCTASTLLVLARDPGIRPIIAVDAKYVYWLSVAADAGSTGSILRVPK